MIRYRFTIASWFLLAVFLSCGTVKAQGQADSVKNGAWEYRGIQVLDRGCRATDFPVSTYNAPPDKTFRSMFSGRVTDSFRQSEFDIFNGRLIVRIGMRYVLYNEEHAVTYNVIIFDFRKNVADGTNVAPGDILGNIESGNAKVLVFSDKLDPYLVLSANRPPVFYAGYFWFNASFLSATGSTRWLTFDPVDNLEKELKETADQVSSEAPGFTVYDKRIRFRMRLADYPRNLSEDERKAVSAYESVLYGRNGLYVTVSEINAGEYKYLMCWQNGFQEYLKKEYALNDEIWLYGTIVTYDVWARKGYVFIRDFTPVAPEQMYEGRLRELKGIKAAL